jgi:spore maturation protein SpmA
MNVVFYVLVLVSVAFAAFAEPGTMAAVSKGALDGAKNSVDFAIGLAGAMTLFLGLVKVIEAGGGLDLLAKLVRPIMVRLFPDVPADHPAMGAIILNITANVLGLVNAATPFGIKAMQELEKLNKHPGTATNAMVLFLAINTSGVAVLPTGMIAMRSTLGSTDPASIFAPTLVATAVNTVIAVAAAKLLQRFSPAPVPAERYPADVKWWELLPLVAAGAFVVGLVAAVSVYGEAVSAWIVPVLILGMLTFGVVRGVKVYEVFIEGARDGFLSATRLIPYLVALFAAVGMFRASGGMGRLVGAVAPLTDPLGMPGEVLPVVFLRPLSGTAAFGITAEVIKTNGPDSYIGQLAATVSGASDTTFYILAVYFGAVGVSRSRHAVPTGLITDFCGVVASVIAVRMLLG